MKQFQIRDGCVVQAYRFALDPNAASEAALRSHCGAARLAYNWAVAWVTASWWQRAAEQSYGVSEAELTPWRPWSLPALRKEWNRVKRTDPRLAWWGENSKEAYSSGLSNAAAAFANYADSKRGTRKGKRVGVPRLKSKRKARLACRFTTGVIRVEDHRHVKLPRIGRIRTHERTSKLLARLHAGTARILAATVRYERGRWFVAFQVETERTPRTPARPEVTVGVDLGVKHLAVLAEAAGQARYVPNPNHTDAAARKLRRLSRRVSRRRGPDRRTGQAPSRRWEKANAARNRVQHQVANLRGDALHKLTTMLAREYGTIVVEDLHVAGMLRNRRLARRIADAGFGQIRRQLAYKGSWNGGQTVVADRWYPSSKTCSRCGAVKAKLPLHTRVFRCDQCGLAADRDHNAAANLAALAENPLTNPVTNTVPGVAGDDNARGACQQTHNDPGPGRASEQAGVEARTVAKHGTDRRLGNESAAQDI